MKKTVEALPVYRDGTAVIEEYFEVLEDEEGETFVTMGTALRWEALHQLNVRLIATFPRPGD